MTTHNSRISRRDALRLSGAAAAGSLLPFGAASAQDAATPAATDGVFPSPLAGVPDAYYQYPEPFASVDAPPGKGGSVSMLWSSDLRIKPRDDNQYWQELEQRLGVTLDITFIPGAAYAERMATAFAGGDFPDIMQVYTLIYPQVSEFMVQGAFIDLTPYLDGDARQAFPNLAAFPAHAFDNSKLNGKLYGVPSPIASQPNGLWYRGDWLEALGLTAPANADEFLQMIAAMTENDPDGNGSPDTYGNASNISNPFETRFVHAMFQVPAEGDGFGFTLSEDGAFTNEIETPEFREAMEYMRQMWDSGAVHPDSLTDAGSNLRDLFMGGAVGSISNAYILLNLMRTELAKITPTSTVMGLVPPGHDGSAPVTYNISGYFGRLCIPTSKGEDEARVEELVAIGNYFAAPFGSEEYMFLNWGVEGVHYTVDDDGVQTKTQQGEEEVFNPSLGGLNILYSPHRDEIKYIQDLMVEQTSFGITDPTFSLYSPTAAAMKGELQQLYFDKKNAIGAGREPLSALDDWIEDWRRRGGDKIKQEFADAYEQAQG